MGMILSINTQKKCVARPSVKRSEATNPPISIGTYIIIMGKRMTKEVKEIYFTSLLEKLEKGVRPSKICEQLGVSKQSLQYHLSSLKKKGLIEKVGYGTWRVLPKRSKVNSTNHTTPHQSVRGHAFIWKVQIKRNINWKNRLNFMGVKYTLVSGKSVPRILLNGKKVWFTRGGVVIFEPRSFFAKNSITSKGQAVQELDRTVKAIEKLLELDLRGYRFTTSREHYGLIKNELARQYNGKGEKMYIRDENNSFWMWIDDSLSLGELENNEMMINKQVQDWWNDAKDNKFNITMTDIKGIAMRQEILTKTTKQISNNLISLTKLVYDLENSRK